MSSSSSHSTVTYTSESDVDGSLWGIHFVTPRLGRNTRRNIMDIITTQWARKSVRPHHLLSLGTLADTVILVTSPPLPSSPTRRDPIVLRLGRDPQLLRVILGLLWPKMKSHVLYFLCEVEENATKEKRAGGGERTTRYCTYKDFLNCQPLNFKGTKGAVGLAYWTIGHDAAYEIPWKTLMKMMTEAYYPRSEIKKLETELWNLTVKGTDVVSYTQHFQELALLCSRVVLDESGKVERYVGGLLDSIQGNVMSTRPKMLQEAIKLTNSLMNQNVRAYAARQADNKRRMDNNPKDNHVQQPPKVQFLGHMINSQGIHVDHTKIESIKD
ncbi:reverse transcriptase domain-containing protein [Tanacetum coccineum]